MKLYRIRTIINGMKVNNIIVGFDRFPYIAFDPKDLEEHRIKGDLVELQFE